ncbi:unnamed protein product, partial [Closterium sp. NIES-53]
MATPSVLAFDAEGRAVDFEVWVDDLQLFLQCDRADGLSLFDLTSGASPAPNADADPTVRSQWATRDAAARLAVLARYSSPATAALSRLALPFLFPDLAAFHTVADLITHLRTIDTRYRAALPADFCAKNPPPMYLTLYFLVTRLPESLRVVRDHFLAVCPTTLTVDSLEKALLAAEQSIVAVGASRGDPRTPIFEGCSPSPLLPSVASATATDLGGLESVAVASAPSGRRRPAGTEPLEVTLAPPSLRGVLLPLSCPLSPLPLRPTSVDLSRSVWRQPLAGDAALARARGARERVGPVGAVEVVVEAAEGVGVAVEVVAGVGMLVAAVAAGVAAAVAVVAEVAEVAAVEAEAGVAEVVGVELRSGAALEAVSASSSSSSSSVLATSPPLSSSVSGTRSVSARCFRRLTDAWRQQFPEATEIPRWGELSKAGVAIFDLDFDAILAAMYAMTISDEGDCYRCFPPDPGIGTAALGAGKASALGASASVLSGVGETALSGASASALSGTESASASLTFTLDSGASRSFFRDRTTLTPLNQRLRFPWLTPLGVLSFLASPQSSRVRRLPLASCLVSTSPRSLRT